MPADPLSLGDPDGYGRYGVLEEQPGGLVGHECGRTFPSLGLHAYRGHGTTAAQYRERHGLQRTAGLITADLRARIRDNARAHMASSAGQAFIQAGDPQRAQAARLARSLPWRTATRGDEPSGPRRQGSPRHRSHGCQSRLRGGLLSIDGGEARSVLRPQLRNQARAENCTQPDLS